MSDVVLRTKQSFGTPSLSLADREIRLAFPGTFPVDPITSAPSPQYWFKADAITGLLDNDPVTTWIESFFGRNATQASAPAKPTYKTSIINGLPVVRFSGAQSLSTAAFGPFASPNTLYIVVEIYVSPGFAYIFCDGQTVSVAAGWQSFTVPTTYAGSIVSGVGGTYSIPMVWDVVFDGLSSDITINGTLITTGNAGLNSHTGGMIIGQGGSGFPFGTLPFSGDIAEIIFYNAAHNATTRTSIREDLMVKYGLMAPSPPPPGQPRANDGASSTSSDVSNLVETGVATSQFTDVFVQCKFTVVGSLLPTPTIEIYMNGIIDGVTYSKLAHIVKVTSTGTIITPYFNMTHLFGGVMPDSWNVTVTNKATTGGGYVDWSVSGTGSGTANIIYSGLSTGFSI